MFRKNEGPVDRLQASVAGLKMIVGFAGFVLTFVAVRRFGPALGKRAMARCQEMMARR